MGGLASSEAANRLTSSSRKAEPGSDACRWNWNWLPELTHSNPFAFSAATSSPTSFTITPLLRLGGGA